MSSLFAFLSLTISTRINAQWIQAPIASASVGSLTAVGNRLFAGTDTAVFVSSDDGLHWTWVNVKETPPGGGNLLASAGGRLFDANQNSYQGGAYSQVYASSDTGKTWQPISRGVLGAIPIAFATINQIVFATGRIQGTVDPYSIFRTTNGGDSWSRVSSPAGSGNTLSVMNVMSAGSNLFASTWYYDGSDEYSLYVSPTNGGSWIKCDSGLPKVKVTAMVTDGRFIYAGTFGGGVFRCKPGEFVWSTTFGKFGPDPDILSLAVSGSAVFAGTQNSGILMSSDVGQTWNTVDDGLSSITIPSLLIHGGYLYAASDGGVWRRPLSDLVSQNSVESSQTAVSVQIYPNPITSYTTISIAPDKSSYAEISIVNMLGEVIAGVYSGMLDASEYNFAWETRSCDCVAGIYECVVRMNERVHILPIIVQ